MNNLDELGSPGALGMDAIGGGKEPERRALARGVEDALYCTRPPKSWHLLSSIQDKEGLNSRKMRDYSAWIWPSVRRLIESTLKATNPMF